MKKRLHQLTGIEPEEGKNLGGRRVDEETDENPNLADGKVPPNDMLNQELCSAPY